MAATGADIYAKIGARAVINAQGNRTVLGGSATVPEVTEAMAAVNDTYIEMAELLARSGEYIADLLGVEAAYVTSGCSAALAFSAAACMTGRDVEKIAQIPDTTGMKSEIIIQKAQRYSYDRSFTVPGAKLVEAGDEDGCSREQLEAIIGDNTAAVAYLVRPGDPDSVLTLEQTVEIAHDAGVPVIADAAAQIYPLDYFRRNAQAADIACFGAKYMGAPQSSGFLCGKKELVDAASDQGFIAFQENGGASFGRPMKLDKQEVVGVVTAVERWLSINHEDRLLVFEERLESMQQELGATPGVKAEIEKVPLYFGSHLSITIDADVVGKTAQDIADELDSGSPRIAVSVVDDRTLTATSHALNEGEELLVAERIRTASGG
jgi:L-seryl-tRNA(Ser) seleniumtransferase